MKYVKINANIDKVYSDVKVCPLCLTELENKEGLPFCPKCQRTIMIEDERKTHTVN